MCLWRLQCEQIFDRGYQQFTIRTHGEIVILQLYDHSAEIEDSTIDVSTCDERQFLETHRYLDDAENPKKEMWI